MVFLQEFHLIIKYKKGDTNKLECMLWRLPTTITTTLGTLIHMEHFTHGAENEEYTKYKGLKEVFHHLQGQFHVEEGDNKDSYFVYQQSQ